MNPAGAVNSVSNPRLKIKGSFVRRQLRIGGLMGETAFRRKIVFLIFL